MLEDRCQKCVHVFSLQIHLLLVHKILCFYEYEFKAHNCKYLWMKSDFYSEELSATDTNMPQKAIQIYQWSHQKRNLIEPQFNLAVILPCAQ